jgi:hypothetical protein
VIVQDVEWLAVLSRLVKDIENPGDVVALVERLPNLLRMAFGQHLMDCRRGTRPRSGEEGDSVAQLDQPFTQEIDDLLNAAVPLWWYWNPRWGEHGDLERLTTIFNGIAGGMICDYHGEVPSPVARYMDFLTPEELTSVTRGDLRSIDHSDSGLMTPIAVEWVKKSNVSEVFVRLLWRLQ